MSWSMSPGHWGRQPPIGVGKLPTPMLCCLPRCAGRSGRCLPRCSVACPNALGGLVVPYPDALLPAPVRWAVWSLPTPMLCCLPQCAGRPGSSCPNVLLPGPVRWAVWSLPSPMLYCLPQCAVACPGALNGLAVPAQCTVSCPNRVERRVGTADGARCYWRPAGTGYVVRPAPGRGAPPEASSVAKWTPPLPASCSACVRHEKPSARYTAPGSSSRAGNSDSPATPTDTS